MRLLLRQRGLLAVVLAVVMSQSSLAASTSIEQANGDEPKSAAAGTRRWSSRHLLVDVHGAVAGIADRREQAQIKEGVHRMSNVCGRRRRLDDADEDEDEDSEEEEEEDQSEDDGQQSDDQDQDQNEEQSRDEGDDDDQQNAQDEDENDADESSALSSWTQSLDADTVVWSLALTAIALYVIVSVLSFRRQYGYGGRTNTNNEDRRSLEMKRVNLMLSP